jgi:hypothetical protein
MRSYHLFSLLFPLLFATKFNHDFTEDNIIHLCQSTADLYLASVESKNESILPLFHKSSYFLSIHLKELTKDRVKLFKVLWERGDLRTTHFIVGTIPLLLNFNPKQKGPLALWKEQLNSDFDLAKLFFQNSKDLMHSLCKEKNWSDAKNVLEILLLLQRKYLYYIKSNKEEFEKVERWIREYEIIFHCFNPRNSDLPIFLGLFRNLQFEANKFVGGDLSEETLDFAIFKQLNLFRLYRHYFYENAWEEFQNVSNHSPDLLYLLLFDLSEVDMFRFLKNKQIGNPNFFFVCNEDFSKIKTAYEKLFHKKIKITLNSFEDLCMVLVFMNYSSEGSSGTFGLGDKEIWLIKTFFYINSRTIKLEIDGSVSFANGTKIHPY